MKQDNTPDFTVGHFRDPGYIRRMQMASDTFLAALKREHPHIIARLLTNQKRGA